MGKLALVSDKQQNNVLVFENNGEVVTDSLTVAEMFGKEHKNVNRDIEVQLEKLAEANEAEWGRSTLGRPSINILKTNNGIKIFINRRCICNCSNVLCDSRGNENESRVFKRV